MADDETLSIPQGESNALELRLHRLSMSQHEDAGDDPFQDIEELEDPATTSTTPPNPNRLSSEPLTKFVDEGEEEEDWDAGVDAKDAELFEAPPATQGDEQAAMSQSQRAYVRSKIQELATVQEQAESTKDNPNILIALGAVLDAMRQQIEKAYDHAKINAQDHATLLERLHHVRELVASK